MQHPTIAPFCMALVTTVTSPAHAVKCLTSLSEQIDLLSIDETKEATEFILIALFSSLDSFQHPSVISKVFDILAMLVKACHPNFAKRVDLFTPCFTRAVTLLTDSNTGKLDVRPYSQSIIQCLHELFQSCHHRDADTTTTSLLHDHSPNVVAHAAALLLDVIKNPTLDKTLRMEAVKTLNLLFHLLAMQQVLLHMIPGASSILCEQIASRDVITGETFKSHALQALTTLLLGVRISDPKWVEKLLNLISHIIKNASVSDSAMIEFVGRLLTVPDSDGPFMLSLQVSSSRSSELSPLDRLLLLKLVELTGNDAANAYLQNLFQQRHTILESKIFPYLESCLGEALLGEYLRMGDAGPSVVPHLTKQVTTFSQQAAVTSSSSANTSTSNSGNPVCVRLIAILGPRRTRIVLDAQRESLVDALVRGFLWEPSTIRALALQGETLGWFSDALFEKVHEVNACFHGNIFGALGHLVSGNCPPTVVGDKVLRRLVPLLDVSSDEYLDPIHEEMLTCLGDCAQAMGGEFKFHLVHALFPALQGTTSTDENVARAADDALVRIARASGYKDVGHLLSENVDYFVDSLISKLPNFPEASKTVHVLLKKMGDTWPLESSDLLLRDLVTALCESLQNNTRFPDRLATFLTVLEAVILGSHGGDGGVTTKWVDNDRYLNHVAHTVIAADSIEQVLNEFSPPMPNNSNEVDNPEEEEVQLSEMAKLLQRVVQESSRFFADPDAVVRRQAVHVAARCMTRLVTEAPSLLKPLVHEVWPEMLHQLEVEKLPEAAELLLNAFLGCVQATQDFMVARFINELWPVARTRLSSHRRSRIHAKLCGVFVQFLTSVAQCEFGGMFFKDHVAESVCVVTLPLLMDGSTLQDCTLDLWRELARKHGDAVWMFAARSMVKYDLLMEDDAAMLLLRDRIRNITTLDAGIPSKSACVELWRILNDVV